MPRQLIRPLCALSLTAGISIACAPKIARFTVTPSHICAGTAVKLDAQVTGKPTLTVDPPAAVQPGNVYRPQVTTHFVISVKRWPSKKPAGSEAEVRVLPVPGEPDEVTAKVRCDGTLVSGTLGRDASEWDPRLQVVLVETGEDRELTVTHAGRTARLTREAPSTRAFEGTSPGGEWTISSPLPAGQTCASAATIPVNLNVSAQVRCGS
jgi:hypothetical protein